ARGPRPVQEAPRPRTVGAQARERSAEATCVTTRPAPISRVHKGHAPPAPQRARMVVWGAVDARA
ncbi:hypothetical protein M885DRAFT_539475, partial [Pelagophyceae sp. CCMP2097]